MLHKLFSVFTFCHWVFLFGTKESCFCVTPKKKKKKELIVKVRIFFSIFPYARGQLLNKGVFMNRKKITSPFWIEKVSLSIEQQPPESSVLLFLLPHCWLRFLRERERLLLTHDGHSVIIEVHRVYFALNRDHEIFIIQYLLRRATHFRSFRRKKATHGNTTRFLFWRLAEEQEQLARIWNTHTHEDLASGYEIVVERFSLPPNSHRTKNARRRRRNCKNSVRRVIVPTVNVAEKDFSEILNVSSQGLKESLVSSMLRDEEEDIECYQKVV